MTVWKLFGTVNTNFMCCFPPPLHIRNKAERKQLKILSILLQLSLQLFNTATPAKLEKASKRLILVKCP